jgi:hypothetical protein
VVPAASTGQATTVATTSAAECAASAAAASAHAHCEETAPTSSSGLDSLICRDGAGASGGDLKEAAVDRQTSKKLQEATVPLCTGPYLRYTPGFCCYNRVAAAQAPPLQASASALLHPAPNVDSTQLQVPDHPLQLQDSSSHCNAETHAALSESPATYENYSLEYCMRFSPRVSRTSGFFLAKILKI